MEIPAGLGAFDLSGRVAVVTGGSGTLGSAMALGLAGAGARVAVLGRHQEALERTVTVLEGLPGAPAAMALCADVLDEGQLSQARDQLLASWGRVDILVNGAGGNQAAATVPPGGSFLDLDMAAVRSVVDLNLMGTLLPTQAFGRAMAETKRGSIINVSSMTASYPLSRVVGYGAAKAGVENLTRWLSDHMARSIGPEVRVNAVAPGFFLAEQNRSLLTNPDGSLTERGAAVVARTPMARFGAPSELVGTVVWLASPASAFVTGAVVPVDGGFSAVAGI